ncbi:MAG: sigma 54-interacting transcriptional regulator, partial [Desulfobacterota bacterium]|nr:sigma 54-interacting transcriptional regulator [Thermodesulfobacteriota bacterium]
MAAQILIIDDDASLLAIMKTTLLSAGFSEPVLVQDSSMALNVVHKGRFAVALIDLVMPKVGGMELLRQIKETRPEVECIIITALDEVSSAVEAMRYGAYDYLVKPLDETRLILTIQRALDHHALRQELSVLKEQPSFDHIKNPDAFSSMIAADEAMAKVFVLAEAASVTDYNILITGESGTGKELLARVIHALSNRKTGPFVAVNMASFNRALFEDSFFGHEKGAYTGAHQETIGFLERADKGTI